MKIFLARGITITFCVLLFPLGVASALEPGESIVLDPVTGNYKLTYSETIKRGVKVLAHATFFPATKIDPLISSKFRLDGLGVVTYSYSISSGKQSRQILTTFRFDLVSKILGSQDLPTDIHTATSAQAYTILEANKLALATPNGWRGAISNDGASKASFISWHSLDTSAGIQPQGHLKGFGFSSQSLPSVGVAQFEGKRDAINGYAGEGPDPESEFGQQIQALDDKDFVPRNAAIPAIAIPVPFDAAVLLDSIRAQIAIWPSKQLLDPTFATQLDRYIVSSADAYRRNQTKAGKEHIKTLREMLKREHKNLDQDDDDGEDSDEHKAVTRLTIDRLAARVLDFDLKYVLNRIEREKEQHGDKDHH